VLVGPTRLAGLYQPQNKFPKTIGYDKIVL
jgi:hypothetical protein